jgi:opacity protein-like surface antigen
MRRHPGRTSFRAALAAALILVAAAAHAERARVTANRANMRAQPRADSSVIWTLDRGTEVEVVARSGDWWQVKVTASGSTGWVNSSFLALVEDAAAPAPPQAGSTPAAEPAPTPAAPPPAAEPVAPPQQAAPRAPRQATSLKVDTRPRFKMELDGAFGATSSTFEESRPITEFAEEGVIDTDYEGKAGPGFEVGMQYRFTRSLGVGAAFGMLNRDEDGTFAAQLPHPLFFNRDRQVTGTVSGYKLKETAFHLGLVFTGGGGSLDYSLFAGASFIKVESDILDELQYNHAYPYDTVTVTGTPSQSLNDNPVGFHVGGGLDFHLGRRFGLGAKVRYSQAKAELAPEGGQPIEVDAGGLQVGAGIRIFF